ncbi:hypothetical protein HYH02_000867 [Chlamydomonas schloesseri]|uniref:Uncharacterized protein n=1 Tax=Chlamydomonas schloesseri TaxID=2026947 RepID=A0A835WX45_9CHLO|nr:hypothetical protein HYH02_000867 [Chlamydomonas schloesseri]|eukprot:KAG2455042.1 hypothetical protein HYH02_000867 [Chlamydomonas schloesseri]
MLHRGGAGGGGGGGFDGGGASATAAQATGGGGGAGSLARHLLAPLGCSSSAGGAGGGFGGSSSNGRHHHTLLPLDTQGAAGCKAKPSPAKVRRRWDTAHRVCNALLMALGLWLALSSSVTMRGPAATHGLVLGGGLVALGGLGLAACGRDCLSLRSLLLLGLGVAGLSTMDLMQQVGRDVGTHCALAEAHTRIRHLEGRLEAMRHDELITQLFFRMNEMDDMLGLVQQAAVATSAEAVEKHTALFRAAQADKDYLRAKAASLRRHAVAVAEALRARAAESKANGTAQHVDVGGGGSVADSLWGVERRLEAVESVVRYLDSKEAGGDLSYEEYEIILEALLEGSQGHAAHHTMGQLQQEKSGLQSVKAVYERHVAGAYDHVVTSAAAAGGGGGGGGATFMAAAGMAGAPGAGAGAPAPAGSSYPLGGRSPGGGVGASAGIGAVTKAQARKESSRRHFENRFMDIFNQHGAHHAAAFRASLGAALDSLPEHCVRDVDARQRLGVLGWALLLTQFAAGYTALTAYTLVAKKDD